MDKKFNTIIEENQICIEEKSSKFFGLLFHVETEEEVKKILKETWDKNKSARHVVFAYKIIENNMEKTKYSDDGEPQGTAGQPILKIIETKNLKNVLIVVVRYFGGILLGTGLLGRTYMTAAKNVVDMSKIVEVEEGIEEKIEIDYKDVNIFKNMIEKLDGKIISQEFLEKVVITYQMKKKNHEQFSKNISDNDMSYKVVMNLYKFL